MEKSTFTPETIKLYALLTKKKIEERFPFSMFKTLKTYNYSIGIELSKYNWYWFDGENELSFREKYSHNTGESTKNISIGFKAKNKILERIEKVKEKVKKDRIRHEKKYLEKKLHEIKNVKGINGRIEVSSVMTLPSGLFNNIEKQNMCDQLLEQIKPVGWERHEHIFSLPGESLEVYILIDC